MKGPTAAGLITGVLLAGPALWAHAQDIDLGGPLQPARKGQQVSFVAEPESVTAGRQAVLNLRFQVRPGYHVNSHTPKSELLLPTQLEIAGPGVTVARAGYPAGKPFRLAEETLDVYLDDFVVQVPVLASAGSYTLTGELKYQACDRAACYPPRSLPVTVVFEAK